MFKVLVCALLITSSAFSLHLIKDSARITRSFEVDGTTKLGSIDFPALSKTYTDNQAHVSTTGYEIVTNIPTSRNVNIGMDINGTGWTFPSSASLRVLVLTGVALSNKCLYGTTDFSKMYVYDVGGYVTFWMPAASSGSIKTGYRFTIYNDTISGVSYRVTAKAKPSPLTGSAPFPDSINVTNPYIKKQDTLSRVTDLYEFASVQSGGLIGSNTLKDSAGMVIVTGDSLMMQGAPVVGNNFKITPEGGYAIRLINKTGAESIKGYVVQPCPSADTACTLCVVNVPDPIGVIYEDGVPDGSPVWVVVSGMADVYFVGDATRHHLARGFVSTDAGYVAGQALSEAVPTSPFATDKHFYEIGHVLRSHIGAGTTRCVLHFN